MPRQRLLVTAEQAGNARTTTLQGREVTVLPVVMVRDQVLNNNLGRTYVPPEELETSMDAWNGIDAVLRHPEKHGEPISARSPDVLNESGVGRLFNARMDGDKLKADAYLDHERMAAFVDGGAVLNALEEGNAVEVSTGFGVGIIEKREGVINGEPFDLILRDIQPDHLAILTEGIGACSVDDGCGLAVENEDGESDEGEDMTEEEMADNVARKVWAYLKRVVTNQDEMSLDDIREAVDDEAERVFGGSDRWVWIAELFEDRAIISVDRQGQPGRFFEVEYTLDEETMEVEFGEQSEVERITEFVPVDNGRSLEVRHEYLAANPTPEEGDMSRDELLNALCECEKVVFQRETLEAMSDEELAHVANTHEVGEADEEKEGDEPEIEDNLDVSGQTDGDSEVAAALSKLSETVNEFGTRLSKLEEETEPARNQTEQERARLISDIVANSDYETEDLEERPMADLQKLHGVACRQAGTFAGLGGPRKSNPSGNSVDLGFTVGSTIEPRNSKEN